MYVFGVKAYLFCTLGQCLSPPSRIRMYAHRTHNRSPSLQSEDLEERGTEVEEEDHSHEHAFASERLPGRAVAPMSSSAAAMGPRSCHDLGVRQMYNDSMCGGAEKA
jgi:hypothetical protein